VLGVAFGLAVLVGNTIGMGILRTPGEVAAAVPSAPIFMAVWVAGAAYALLGALSVAELGAMIPRSGGLFPLVFRGLGRFPGFVSGWADWIGTCGSLAAVALVVGEYSGPLFPALGGRPAIVAGGVVVAFGLLQWRGIRIGNVAQQTTSLLKAIGLLGLATVALVAAPAEAAPRAAGALSAPGGLAMLAAVVVGLQSVIVTYDGWTGPVYFGEEVRDPGRDIPRSMIGGVLLVLLIYLALNLAFLRVVPVESMAGDPFVAGTVATELFGQAGDAVVRGVTIVSLLAAANALLLMASRIPFAMSAERMLPRMLHHVNPGGTPVPALAASTVLALAFASTTVFSRLLALLAFFFVANYVLTFAALFRLRRREPEAPRPFRAPGYPWVPGAALLGSVVFLAAAMWGDRANSLVAVGLVAVSWPLYRWGAGRGSG
jgi:APA family basic amino acid/polyamine antiporter